MSSRRYIAPAPPVHVIDFAATAGQDRFSPPKASILSSPDGKLVYGVQDRPACRVLRYQADAASSAACAPAEDRQSARPAGRRHDAYHTFLDSVRRNERQWGFEAVQTRSAARSSATVYSARLGGSEGVANCLVWHPDLQQQQQQEEGEDAEGQSPARSSRRLGAPSTLARPSTAPAAASRSPTSLDFWNEVPYSTASPRFKSRTTFEQRRCATPDTDAMKRRGYLAQHQQRKAAATVKEAREGELIAAWPHGLPRSELRRACASGLRLLGLGIGGNPLSLPYRQYQALRPGMKWY